MYLTGSLREAVGNLEPTSAREFKAAEGWRVRLARQH
jgi:hypothetical protein